MKELESQKLYWLGANVVLANQISDGRWDIHRLDGRESYRLCEDGKLWPMKWRNLEWEVCSELSSLTTDDLSPLTEDEKKQYGGFDFFIMPSGVMVPVATLFPGKAKGAHAYRPRLIWVDDYCDRWKDKISKGLDGYGLDYVFSNNNAEAMDLLQDSTQRFDLIMQDLQRPPGECLEGIETADGELTGLVFYEHCVRKVRPALPCVFVTAIADHPFVQNEISRLGLCRAVSKPWNWSLLVEAIRDLV